MARKYKRVQAVPGAQFSGQSLTLLAYLAGASAEECAAVVRAIDRAFKTCKKRDFDGEIPTAPDGLSEAGRDAYDALMNDMWNGIVGYWEMCGINLENRGGGDDGRPGGDGGSTGVDVKKEVKKEVNERHRDFTNTVGVVSASNALYRIETAGIQTDNGLRGYIKNLGNSLTDDKLSRAIEYCICHGMTESRAFTGTLRNIIEQDGWRE